MINVNNSNSRDGSLLVQIISLIEKSKPSLLCNTSIN